jgi:hypothetical protein
MITLILQQRWATAVILKYKKITDMLSVGPTPVQECIKASISAQTSPGSFYIVHNMNDSPVFTINRHTGHGSLLVHL